MRFDPSAIVKRSRDVSGRLSSGDAQRTAQRRIRALIWRYYRSLKAWRRHPSPARKATLSARFDRIFGSKTGFATLAKPKPLNLLHPISHAKLAADNHGAV